MIEFGSFGIEDGEVLYIVEDEPVSVRKAACLWKTPEMIADLARAHAELMGEVDKTIRDADTELYGLYKRVGRLEGREKERLSVCSPEKLQAAVGDLSCEVDNLRSELLATINTQAKVIKELQEWKEEHDKPEPPRVRNVMVISSPENCDYCRVHSDGGSTCSNPDAPSHEHLILPCPDKEGDFPSLCPLQDA